jgi:hypothetical protein
MLAVLTPPGKGDTLLITRLNSTRRLFRTMIGSLA